MRVMNADNPLDASAVHPESYPIVEKMAADTGVSVRELISNEKTRQRIDLKKYMTPTVGLPTLRDIISELAKPGRDPRAQFEFVRFMDGVNTITDLQPDMVLPGVVTNIIDFGCFVDIGVHHDGLVHISQMSDKFVRHPSDVVKLHQKVTVKVKEIDLKRQRISLTMKLK